MVKWGELGRRFLCSLRILTDSSCVSVAVWTCRTAVPEIALVTATVRAAVKTSQVSKHIEYDCLFYKILLRDLALLLR